MGPLGLVIVLAQAPVCVPGTTVCASSDGRGGIKVDASGNAQASPQGASAAGQVSGDGNANGNTNAAANGNGQATGQSSGSGGGYSGGGDSRRGRFGTGVTLCPIARIGVWSGFKVGGCVAVGFRWDSAALELETQLLYGGVTRSFDWTLPVSLVVPLANDDSLFQGPYLRFGGSPVGATFARQRDGGSFVRFGLFAGGGYELNFADWAAWRVIDIRLSFDVGTKRAMDDKNHWIDPGLQLGTGLVF